MPLTVATRSQGRKIPVTPDWPCPVVFLNRRCAHSTSRPCGIGYQHVRHVLLRSWITGGLRRQVEAQREPVTVDPAPKSRAATSWEVLTSAGFRLLGEWTRDPESALRLDAEAPRAPGVYAFVVDDVVVYVGLTKSGLHRRFEQYQ
jgi:hypothetical protein